MFIKYIGCNVGIILLPEGEGDRILRFCVNFTSGPADMWEFKSPSPLQWPDC